MFNKFPKRSGIYNIKDNIECLEFRIYFRHVNTLLKLPKFDYNKNIKTEYWNSSKYETDSDDKQKSEIATTAERKNNSNDNEQLRVVQVKWQEKLFSSDDIECYKDLKNCLTDVQKQYHTRIQAMLAVEAAGDEMTERHSKRKKKRKRGKRQQIQQPTDEPIEMKLKARFNEIFTYTHEDNHKPNDGTKAVRFKKIMDFVDADVKHMFVYAAIKPDTQLMHLQWHKKKRLLHIYPDFNDFTDNPYFIEIDTDYRHLYAYAIENVSPTRYSDDSKQPRLLDFIQLPELNTAHWQSEAELSKHFAMPPKRMRRIALLCELREALNFERDSLHVRYYVELPPNTIHEEGLLEASTHTALASRITHHCHFGYNWQLTLLCEETYDPSEPLRIYFEVISIDSWQRERIEGYAYLAVHLELSNNILDRHLHCLRPIDSFWDALNRYFVGGRRLFDYKRFFTSSQMELQHEGGDAEDTDERCDGTESIGKFHNRYGCRMQQTGNIHLTCQIISQRNCELLNPCSSRTSGMTLDDIMSAYREARCRLEALME